MTTGFRWPLDRARSFNEICKIAGMSVPPSKPPVAKSTSNDDALAKALRDALLRSQATPILSADALLAKMTGDAAALYPKLTREQAFTKALREDQRIRAQYLEYRKAWRDELPAREAAVGKQREANQIAKRQAVEAFEAAQGPAFALLTQKGEELRRANPTLTTEQAFTKACRENRDLYARYRQEKRVA